MPGTFSITIWIWVRIQLYQGLLVFLYTVFVDKTAMATIATMFFAGINFFALMPFIPVIGGMMKPALRLPYSIDACIAWYAQILVLFLALYYLLLMMILGEDLPDFLASIEDLRFVILFVIVPIPLSLYWSKQNLQNLKESHSKQNIG
jgi:hypothetical protein